MKAETKAAIDYKHCIAHFNKACELRNIESIKYWAQEILKLAELLIILEK